MSVSIPRVPVAPSTNVRKVVSFALLFAFTVTFVASVAVAAFPVHEPELPVAFPINAPANVVAVTNPLLGL